MAIPQIAWYALGVFATLNVYWWLIEERRITTTSIMSAATFGLMAVTARDVQAYTGCGAPVEVGSATMQYVAVALALLSFLAFILYRFGEYPPAPDEV